VTILKEAPDASLLHRVVTIYTGSDGAATTALYVELSALGSAGEVATNLFRAQKASERAKKYRGGIPGRGSYKSMAYDRKGWAIGNLTRILTQHADALGIRWGWQRDPSQRFHEWVLYVDLPTGQASFHAAIRGDGPDYGQTWDGVPGASVDRILRHCAAVLADASAERRSA
jgi:hypothetical protein